VLDHIDRQLEGEIRSLSMRTLVTNTLMNSHDDRKQFAMDVLNFIGRDL
jgi:hypothetical protein